MTGPTNKLLAALRDHGYEPRPSGDGWTCRCPAHDDRNPSLCIDIGDNGGVVWHCQAGCDQSAVIAAVGLTFRDLMPEKAEHQNGHGKPKACTTTSAKPSQPSTPTRTWASDREAVGAMEARRGEKNVGWWPYHNSEGERIGVVVRWNHAPDPANPDAKPGKTVLPFSRQPDGRWACEKIPNPHPLYDLHLLAKAPKCATVYIVEGEKTCEAAKACGLLATTSAGGEGRAKGTDWTPLAGHPVVIVPDHDDAGEGYGADVARLALAAGAASVKIIQLWERWPDLPERGDLVDLLAHYGGDADRVRADVEMLADKAEQVMPEPVEADPVPVWRPFPTSTLPEPIRSFVAESAKSGGCDDSFVAVPLLAALAAAVGNSRVIELKHDWTEPCVLWCVTVGESGDGKSPGMDKAVANTMDRQKRAMAEYAAAKKQHDEDFANYERAAEAWKKSGASSPAPEKPVAPVCACYWTDDATTEAMAMLLQQSPRGVLMKRDELAGWFGSFDKYNGKGGGDVARWLEIHGARSIKVDRKTSAPLYVPRAAVSIAGGIQPGALRRVIGDQHKENGLLARLFMAFPPRKAEMWTEAVLSPVVAEKTRLVFDVIYALEADPDQYGDLVPRRVTLDATARAAWIKYFNRCASERVGLIGADAAAAAKLLGGAARLALVVHLVRVAAGDTRVRDPNVVDVESMVVGIALADWFKAEAKRIYAMFNESDEDREDRPLLDWIRRKGGVVTARELSRGPSQYKPPGMAEAALERLVSRGLGRWEPVAPNPNGGPHTRRLRLRSGGGDTGDGDTTPKTQADGGGFVTVTTVTGSAGGGDDWGKVPQ